MVAITIGDIDVAPRAADRADIRVDRNVRRFVQQRVAGVVRGGFAAGAERVTGGLRTVAHPLCADLHEKGGSGALRHWRLAGCTLARSHRHCRQARYCPGSRQSSHARRAAYRRRIRNRRRSGSGWDCPSPRRCRRRCRTQQPAAKESPRRWHPARQWRPIHCPDRTPFKVDADLPAAVEGVDVVVLVHAAAGDLAGHPGVGDAIAADRRRQRFGPEGIDGKSSGRWPLSSALASGSQTPAAIATTTSAPATVAPIVKYRADFMSSSSLAVAANFVAGRTVDAR